MIDWFNVYVGEISGFYITKTSPRSYYVNANKQICQHQAIFRPWIFCQLRKSFVLLIYGYPSTIHQILKRAWQHNFSPIVWARDEPARKLIITCVINTSWNLTQCSAKWTENACRPFNINFISMQEDTNGNTFSEHILLARLLVCKHQNFQEGKSGDARSRKQNNRSSQFSSSFALGKLFASRNRLCPRANIRAYFRAKWRLQCCSLYK